MSQIRVKRACGTTLLRITLSLGCTDSRLVTPCDSFVGLQAAGSPTTYMQITELTFIKILSSFVKTDTVVYKVT